MARFALNYLCHSSNVQHIIVFYSRHLRQWYRFSRLDVCYRELQTHVPFQRSIWLLSVLVRRNSGLLGKFDSKCIYKLYYDQRKHHRGAGSEVVSPVGWGKMRKWSADATMDAVRIIQRLLPVWLTGIVLCIVRILLMIIIWMPCIVVENAKAELIRNTDS